MRSGRSGFAVPESFESVDRCVCCGGATIGPAVPPNIDRCRSCGVLFRNPRPSQAWISRHYNRGGTYDAWACEAAERTDMWQRRLRWLRAFSAGGRLLDLGAGDGHFMDASSRAGYRTVGTELSEEGARRARDRGLSLLVGQLEELDLAPYAPFDIVTAWHVMEHVPWPGRTCDRIRDLLRPGGRLVVAVPNEENRLMRWRLRGRRSECPLGDASYQEMSEVHLTHFQPSSLKRFMRDHGFRVLAFGVDDVYRHANAYNRTVIAGHRLLSRMLGWHFGIAMVAVGERTA